MSDAVNHPPHYQGTSGIEAADVIDDFGLGYWDGNAVKYVLRAQKKGRRLEDTQKAIWCLQREAARLQASGRAEQAPAEVGRLIGAYFDAHAADLRARIARLEKAWGVSEAESAFAPGGLRT